MTWEKIDDIILAKISNSMIIEKSFDSLSEKISYMLNNPVSSYLTPSNCKKIICHSQNIDLIKITSFHIAKKNIFILNGTLFKSGNKKFDIIVKMNKNKGYVEREIEIYNFLRSNNVPLLWFSTSFKLIKENILVMEKLYSVVESGAEPKDIAIDIIDQLSHIHKFGIHSDIKPDNIMGRKHENKVFVKSSGNDYNYLLIDFGGMSMTKHEDGYLRICHTGKFTSQKPINNILSYPKNDLIELGYTLSYLYWKKSGVNEKFMNFKTNFPPYIQHYMDFCIDLPKTIFLSGETYKKAKRFFLSK